MILENKNFFITNEKMFNQMINDTDKNDYYLYHYIIVIYKINNNIETIKMDQKNDLYKLDNLNVICKYYIKRMHYYNYFDNVMYDEGEPTYIYNIGYFFLDGDLACNNKDREIILKKVDKYNQEYSNMKFPFTDHEFLSNNKSTILF